MPVASPILSLGELVDRPAVWVELVEAGGTRSDIGLQKEMRSSEAGYFSTSTVHHKGKDKSTTGRITYDTVELLPKVGERRVGADMP